jgi:hypothetical protein
LLFIKQVQGHGLTLREVRDLAYQAGQAAIIATGCDLVAERLQELEEQPVELGAFRGTLCEYLTCGNSDRRPRTAAT